MAWYQRNYFSLGIGLILIFFLHTYFFQINAQCFSVRGMGYLKDVHHNGIVFKTSENLDVTHAKKAFDHAYNFIAQKSNFNYSIIKYLYIENNYLRDFPKRSPQSHFHVYHGMFQNLHVSIQLSHSYPNFINFTDNDICGYSRAQQISNFIHIYDGSYKVLYFNEKSLNLNENLTVCENFNKYISEKENANKIQNYLLENKNLIETHTIKAFNFKNN